MSDFPNEFFAPMEEEPPKMSWVETFVEKYFRHVNTSRWFVVLVVIVPILLIAVAALSLYTQRELKKGSESVRAQLITTTLTKANEIRKGMRDLIFEVETITVLVAGPESNASEYIDQAIQKNPVINSVLVAYDPEFLAELRAGKYPNFRLENHFGLLKEEDTPALFCPRAGRGKDGSLVHLDEGEAHYQYRDWYHLAKYLHRGAWTDPYVSRFSRLLICAFSLPIYCEGTFVGVVGVTFDISEIIKSEMLFGLTPSINGDEMFLLADNGKILVHTNQDRWRREGVYTLVSENKQDEIFPQIDTMLSSAVGLVQIPNWATSFPGYNGNENIWFVYAPIQNGADWTLVATFDESRVLAELRHKIFLEWLLGAAVLLLILLILIIITLFIYNPILAMSDVAKQVADGHFNVRVPEQYARRKTEIGFLARNFNGMIANLDELMSKTSNEKSRVAVMERELNIARQIQGSIMADKKSLGAQTRFFLDAVIIPARFVAGDFYDFWRINDDLIAVLIADVSGKGVPAAMIMVAFRTIIRQVAHNKTDPGEILASANEIAQQSNRKYMFATLILSIYNTRTGELKYTNAGHLPPVTLHSDKSVAMLPRPKSSIFGIFPNAQFDTVSFTLGIGDMIFLYTDGVLDTTSADGVLYGEERLRALIAETADQPKEKYLPTMTAKLDDFCSHCQKDDITIIMLKRTA